jgi:ligand-binding sensor domain-containing protein
LSQHLRFSRFTSKDGLSNEQTRGVAQDNYGFMWFATLDGLNRYDGASIKVYRHDPNDPLSLSNNRTYRSARPWYDRDPASAGAEF